MTLLLEEFIVDELPIKALIVDDILIDISNRKVCDLWLF